MTFRFRLHACLPLLATTTNLHLRPHICMVFRNGHRMRLDIQPRDGVGRAPYTHYSADYNSGPNTIYTEGSSAAHLLLPVIPATHPA